MQQTMVKLSERLLFKRPLQLVSQTWYDSCLGAFTSPYYNSSNLHMRIIPSSTALENCPRWMLSSQLFCNSEMMKIPQQGKKIHEIAPFERYSDILHDYLSICEDKIIYQSVFSYIRATKFWYFWQVGLYLIGWHILHVEYWCASWWRFWRQIGNLLINVSRLTLWRLIYNLLIR